MYEISFKESGEHNGEVVIKDADNATRHLYGFYETMKQLAEELTRAYEQGLEDGRRSREREFTSEKRIQLKKAYDKGAQDVRELQSFKVMGVIQPNEEAWDDGYDPNL